MGATTVFRLQNNYHQAGAQGICTAASLDWCRKVLKLGRSVENPNELMSSHALNAQMAVIRKLDAVGADQTERAGLEAVGPDRTILTIDEVISAAKATPPHVLIFWTATHTMAYRYSHLRKEFFDIEAGLFRAKVTKDIRKKMTDIIGGYGPVRGLRVVRLPN
jgi:hypothetical protein